MSEKSVKVAVTGCGLVGKTCLTKRLTTGTCPTEPEWTPSIFEDNYIQVSEGDIVYKITVWDTSGIEEYGNLKKLLYPQADVFILCFALDSPASYHNVIHIYFKEIMKSKLHTPIVLVGTKTDADAKITLEERKRLQKHVNPNFYLECSPLKGTGIEAVLEAVLDAYKNNLKHKSKKTCVVM